MTHDEAIKTVRDFIKTSSKWGVPGTRDALAALDSLAVEPIEDARDFRKALSDKIKIIKLGPGGYSSIATLDDSVIPLITARDERIRRECVDRAVAWFENMPLCTDPKESLRAAIMDEAKK